MLFKIPIQPNKDKCDYFNVIITVSTSHSTLTLIEKHIHPKMSVYTFFQARLISWPIFGAVRCVAVKLISKT